MLLHLKVSLYNFDKVVHEEDGPRVDVIGLLEPPHEGSYEGSTLGHLPLVLNVEGVLLLLHQGGKNRLLPRTVLLPFHHL